MLRRPTILVLLDLKAASDSVDRNTLWYCLSQKGVPIKFVNLLQSLYSQSRGCVRVYDSLSPEFTTKVVFARFVLFPRFSLISPWIRY